MCTLLSEYECILLSTYVLRGILHLHKLIFKLSIRIMYGNDTVMVYVKVSCKINK